MNGNGNGTSDLNKTIQNYSLKWYVLELEKQSGKESHIGKLRRREVPYN